MPAKRVRKPPPAASEEHNIQAIFQKLSVHLDKVRDAPVLIGFPPALLKAINGAITACRAKHILINQPGVDDFVRKLDDDDNGNLCSRLNPEAFSVILRIILQMEACKEAERGLHLLAAALFHEAQDNENHDELDQKKDIIGTQCLVQLLNYFIDAGNDFGMRRWAGLLCIQLIVDCDSNHSKLEQAPEDSRRGIGRQVVEESDEILKVIYAKLVRVMGDKDTPVEDMFPEHYDEELYAGFPASSQGSAGWVVQFQKYVDDVWKNPSTNPPDDIGYLFFTTKIKLTPGDHLGPRHHNAVLFVDGAQLSFLATSRDGHFDTVLDVPISSIKKMTFVSDNTSQIESLRITLDMGEHDPADDELSCFLDAKAVQLEMVSFSMVSKSIDSFQSIILQFQGDIEISQDERADNGGLNYTHATAKVASIDLGESQARSQETRCQMQELGSSNELSRDPGSQHQIQELGSSNELPQSQVSASQAVLGILAKLQHEHEHDQDSNIEEGEDIEQEEDLYNASPQDIKAKEASFVVQSAKPTPKPVIPRGRRGVKPKAKPPIVTGRHSLDSQLAMAKSNTGVTDMKSAKNSNGLGQSVHLMQAKAATNANVKKLASATSATRVEKNGTSTKAPSQNVPITKKLNPSAATKARQLAAPKKGVKPSVVKLRTAAAVNTIDPAYGFSDNLITSPDANDTSTPKISKTMSTAKPTKTVIKPAGTQPKSRLANVEESSAPVRKRYGLHNSMNNASKEKDESIVEAKGRSAQNSAKPKPLPKTKDSKPGVSTKADAKKRQSAPAALQATRHSQRVAASKAKDKMQGVDDSHDNDEIENQSPIEPKSKVIEDQKTTATHIRTKMFEEDAADFEPHSLDDDQALQAEDARSLEVANDKCPPIQQDQDPDDASSMHLAKHADLAPNVPEKAKSFSKPAPINSGRDLAKKLEESLGFLDSEPEQDELQVAIQTKSIALNRRHEESKKAQIATEKDKAGGTAGDQIRFVEQQVNNEVPSWNPSPSGHNSAPSAPNGDTSVVPSPPPLLPNDPDTPFPETAVLPNESSAEVPYPPMMQETIETPMKTHISTEVLKAPQPKFIAQISVMNLPVRDNDSDIVVGEQTALSEEGRQVQAVNVSKKRKPTPEKPVAVKRCRAEQNIEGDHEQDPQFVPPAKAKAAKTKNPRGSKTSSASPTRKSPRLASRATQQPPELKKAAPEFLVSKDPTRKPQIINFSDQGPRNQGVASAAKSNNKMSAIETREEASPAEFHVADRKRKLEKANLAEAASPPKKRQNSSPLQVESNDYFKSASNSTPPPRVAKSNQCRQRLASRPSSQASRVDRNGSPIAGESPIDHFGKLKESLAEPEVQSVPQDSEDAGEVRTAYIEKEPTRPRRASQIFGPKISLGGKLKARPSSPNEANSRYVAHGEAHGVYTDVDTKQVVEEKKILPDPFIERNRKSSGFIERLQSSASMENIRAKNASESRRHSREIKTVRGRSAAAIRSNEDQELPKHTRQKPVPSHGEHRMGLAKQVERKTRPNVYEQSSPSDMTSGTSYGSQSSDAARSPLREVSDPNETWNLAVRPHYNTLGQAIHRIADELIIRLSSEEDKMDLLVDQYKGNGTKLLDSLQKKRENERETLFRNLDQKKSEMAAVFGESKDVIMGTEKSVREYSTSHFEREWRRKQNAIRKRISGGRKSREE
ncbi:hypothetical protein BKA64DRAFT_299623 [Cadophora sp. MPI-SDFR-AT-0126]|nr:hypothetical protein BKA64DRAFT_299623 [Leotiomycetes sp. MPI-SDFR-AT-0126]